MSRSFNLNSLNEEVGLLRRAYISDVDDNRIYVKLNIDPLNTSSQAVEVQMPYSMFYNNGMFIGAVPEVGTAVIVGQGSGGEYFFVSYLSERRQLVPEIKENELLIQSNKNSKITLDLDQNINIGSDNNRLHINTDLNYISRNFNSDYKFTQAARKVEGIIKRDLIRNTNYDQNSKLEYDDYETELFTISMDPSASTSPILSGARKNPAFVEDRKLIYEFQNSSNVTNDLDESSLYSNTGTNTTKSYVYLNRRKSRSDLLSLSLLEPNYLIESVSGTVVDIFGNILDLNRNPLPVGQDQATIQGDKNTDKVKAFLEIKALERKSIAFHWELNARKDLVGKNDQVVLPDINSSDDYARSRSRFFIDIDKEGQFKINVPASSDTGNVPLLTRYENYSSFGKEDNGNPNKLIQLEDNKDIFHDSFAAEALEAVPSGFKISGKGSITLEGSDGANTAPIDRLTDEHIKYGMVYHDIMQTCFVHQNNDFINYQAGEVDPLTVDIDSIEELKDIVSSTIITNGPNANAGGRSGSISLDGFLAVNIGANTVDRQSLWLDTAGGSVLNMGRDKNGRSLIANANGDVLIQVGGLGVSNDSRFVDIDNSIMGGKLDIRILGKGGYAHMIRVDDTGITLLTPGQLRVHSKGDMTLTSDANMKIECNTLTIQERGVIKSFSGSI